MKDYYSSFLNVINEMEKFYPSNQELLNTKEESVYIYPTKINNSLFKYVIRSKKINTWLAELLRVDINDLNNIISFLELIDKLNNTKKENYNFILIFYPITKTITLQFNNIHNQLILPIKKYYDIKEFYDFIDKHCFPIFYKIINNYGYNKYTIKSHDVLLIQKTTIKELINKKNSIQNFKYYYEEEILNTIPNLKGFISDEFIYLNKNNIHLIYPFFDMILDSKNKSYLIQIISLHKLYCYLFNQEFKFKILIPKFYKTSNIENAYSIFLNDFLNLSIGAKFFNLEFEKTILYSFEISNYYNEELNIINNHTNKIEDLYLRILNIYLKNCSEFLNKDIKDITYQDIKLINMLTI